MTDLKKKRMGYNPDPGESFQQGWFDKTYTGRALGKVLGIKPSKVRPGRAHQAKGK